MVEITTKRKFKWLKMLVQEEMSGNLEDDGVTSDNKRFVSWLLIDLEKVDDTVDPNIDPGDVGMKWRLPSQYFSRDYCRTRAAQNGFPEIVNFFNGSDAKHSGTIYSPKFSMYHYYRQLVGEMDAKCSIKDLQWNWSPYPPSPE